MCRNRLRYNPKQADIGSRIGAFFIDHIIISMVVVVPWINSISTGITTFSYLRRSIIVVTLIGLVVHSLKDIIKGASIGKRILGLAVRNSSNPSEVPPVSKLILRNIFMLLWPIEFLVLIFSTKKLGDRIAGTDVYSLRRKVEDIGTRYIDF